MTINFEAILYVCAYSALAGCVLDIVNQPRWKNTRWVYILGSILIAPILLGYGISDLFSKAYREIFKF